MLVMPWVLANILAKTGKYQALAKLWARATRLPIFYSLNEFV